MLDRVLVPVGLYGVQGVLRPGRGFEKSAVGLDIPFRTKNTSWFLGVSASTSWIVPGVS